MSRGVHAPSSNRLTSRFLLLTFFALALPMLIGLAPADDPEPATEQPATEPAPAEPADTPNECVLILKDGRLIRGLLVSHDEHATVVRIAGVDSRFDALDIVNFRELKPLIEQYAAMRGEIEDDDIQSLLMLVGWLRQREMYAEALAEIDAILDIEPFHPDANRLRTWLSQQLTMRTSDRSSADRGRVTVSRRKRLDFPLLSGEEINLIRVYEIDLSDPPKIIIKRDTINELLKAYAGDDRLPPTQAEREALYDRPPVEVLELMYTLRARDLYGQVRVMTDPPAMGYFKKKINGRGGWLVNSCASVRCHGGPDGGRLWLTGRRSNSDAGAYTNFFILDQFRLDDGTPLIDYKEPTRSPLFQMGMRRANSLYPHPDTEQTRGAHGWRAIFRDSSDRKYLRAVEWVQMLYRPRPDYGIAYEPPDPSAKPPEPADPAEPGPGAQPAKGTEPAEPDDGR